ncbi:hypothetical protein Q31b_08190 [Novipirellula aureliae]|uniref:Uncharacterized protein n=1 Tax=Novipirellula aureliae TaxID=2527966 RepID=A0A5C6E7M3_9BACT|nr:hypothetical protein [Novipirellula aureliae]TWU45643.1 hypothetical protein Q31b_08190 [Novipirellula aureliae]
MASVARIRWKTDSALSTLHAARCVAMGFSITERKLEESLIPFVTAINERLLSASVDVPQFWQGMVQETVRSQSLANDSLVAAAEIVLTHSGCNELQVDQTGRAIVRKIDDCRLVMTQRFPRLEDQLELRARPLRDHWDSVGPGLLHQIAKQIWQDTVPKTWWPPRVNALLVQPMRGGDGGFDSGGSKIWIEAMLTNADPRIPEVLRVAWLVTRLAIEQHLSEKPVTQVGLCEAWSFAAVAITLNAAAELELIAAKPLSGKPLSGKPLSASPLPIADAVSLWRISDHSSLGNLIDHWWQQFASNPTPLPVALKSLAHSINQVN